MKSIINELENPKYFNTVSKNIYEKDQKVVSLDLFLKSLKEIKEGSFEWGTPILIKIPKGNGEYREVFTFSEEHNLLQKIITEIINVNFSDKISDNVFSYRKGLSAGIAAKFIKENKNNLYFYKLDLSNFFLSVSKNIIDRTIDELFGEDCVAVKLLKSLFSINEYVDRKTGEIHEKFLSLIPGSPLASVLSNIMLKSIDDEFSNKLPLYSRYSDDLLIAGNSKEELDKSLIEVSDILRHNGFDLNNKKTMYFRPEDKLTYLGLEISSEDIILSRKNIKKIKSYIKSTCKQLRKDFELKSKFKNEEGDIDLLLEKAIRKINRKFYKSVFDTSRVHKGNKVTFAYNCITNISCLREIDFYLKDNLNYLVKGKHNSKVYFNQEYLEKLGFLSLTKMYNLFRKDKEVFLYKCYMSDRSLGGDKIRYKIKNDEYKILPSRVYEDDKEFITDYKYLYLEIIEDKKAVYKDCVRFDFKNKTISIGTIPVFVDGNPTGNTIYFTSVLNPNDVTPVQLNFKLSKEKDISINKTLGLYFNLCAKDKINPILYNRNIKILNSLEIANHPKNIEVNPGVFSDLEYYLYIYKSIVEDKMNIAGFHKLDNYYRFCSDGISIVFP